MLNEAGPFLPLTMEVLLSSQGRPGVLSSEATLFLGQRRSVWMALNLLPGPPGVLADASHDLSTPVGSFTADPLAKLMCAALILQLQQSALLDVVRMATLLCFLAVSAMTGAVLLHTPRRALLYLCSRTECFTCMISAGMGGTADRFAAVACMLAATGRPRWAIFCCLTSVAGQLLRISEQPWDVLLTAALLRIGFKAATSKCLAWLVRYCSSLPAPSDAVRSVAPLLLA